MVTQEFKRSAFSESTSDGPLVLLTITHPDLTEPFRIVNDKAESIVSRGETFFGFAFTIDLPDSPETGFGSSRLVIDNVSREIGARLRAIQTPAEVLIEVIRIEDLDSVERKWAPMQLINVQGNASQISGDLEKEQLNLEPFPVHKFTYSIFPGLRG